MTKDRIGISRKVANLAALRQAGFPVKRFVEISEKDVLQIIAEQQVPYHIIDNIMKELAVEPLGVAVRSAAIGEDGENLAWPGQFKTVLYVHTEELPRAILECANAQNGSEAKAYAKIHNVAIPQLKLFVQEMVNAEYAGVSFTADPITGSDEILIESVTGTSDGLVNGVRQPTSYCFDGKTSELIRKKTSKNEDNGLSDNLLSKVLASNKAVHLFFNKPQDIEWAVERATGIVFINQSRDITGLKIKEFSKIRAGAIRKTANYILLEMSRLKKLGVLLKSDSDILSDQNIAELLTPHPCQLAFGLFTYEFAHSNGAIRTARNEMGYQIGEELNEGFFHLVGSQPRCSIIHDAATYRIQGIPLNDYSRIIDYYLQQIRKDESLGNYPELVLYEQNPSIAFLADIFGWKKAGGYFKAYENFFSGIKTLENQLDDFCFREFLPSWNEKMTFYEREEIPLEIAELSGRFQKICRALKDEACCMFVKVARLGFFSLARLNRLLVRLFGKGAERHSDVLTCGIPLELNPNLRFSVELAGLKDGRTSMRQIVEEFGHLSAHELEISVPRYHEQKELLEMLAVKIPENILQVFQNSSERARQSREKLLAEAGTQALELEREVYMARTYLPLREMVKFAYLRAYDLLRRIAVRIEQRLGWEKDLIFNLDPKEIFFIEGKKDMMRELAGERSKLREENRSLYVPSVIASDQLEKIGGDVPDNARILKGIGVTNVVAEGRVVVIPGLQDTEKIKDVRSGTILVTVTTDPGWSAVLSVVGREGALVTEIGGKLAHGAIYAREIGMAAVLNVPDAARILKTGMRVRVNGPQNCVEILEQS